MTLTDSIELRIDEAKKYIMDVLRQHLSRLEDDRKGYFYACAQTRTKHQRNVLERYDKEISECRNAIELCNKLFWDGHRSADELKSLGKYEIGEK